MQFQNRYIGVSIETEPFFRIKSFRNTMTGEELFSGEEPVFLADRKNRNNYRFLGQKEICKNHWELRWELGPITISRQLFFYENAPALRWYDEFTTEENLAAVYYSDLAAVKLSNPCGDGKVCDFFSCSDQSNHRLIEKEAVPGKNKGGFFFGNGLFFYKEGPLPDCQPIKCEYDFLLGDDRRELRMLGLGFDNLRKGEPRRANGVVIGLTGDFGMQRYWLERYRDFPENAETDVLSNSWPDLEFGVNEAAIERELYMAAESGITCVFIDDGWFSTFMGEIDEQKFPNRFRTLADIAKHLGVELGLWCNPLGLDVKHPQMSLWDGAECHDSMREEIQWNWLARTDDFSYAQLVGSCQESRSYAPPETLNPEVFNHIKEYISGIYREYGIRHFKFDLYQLTAFNTLLGDANVHYEVYRKLLEELQKAIPGVVISMDVTRRNRPNFDFALDFGRLFLENRGRRLKDHRYYHPYMALGNFHDTMRLTPARQLEIEMMPQIEDYPLDYILGTTVFGAPLYWGSLTNLPQEKRRAMKHFYNTFTPFRKRIAVYLNVPLGAVPARGNWSAILSAAPNGEEAYLAVYRHGSSEASFSLDLPYHGTVLENIYGGMRSELVNGNRINVQSSGDFAFAFFRISQH